jgi:mRNA interferase HigB
VDKKELVINWIWKKCLSLRRNLKRNLIKMTISGKRLIDEFVLKHARSRSSFIKWIDEIEGILPTGHNELKKLFPSADYVGNKRYVFNIGGNNYRLVAVVAFVEGILFVRWCGTHAEYNKIGDISKL